MRGGQRHPVHGDEAPSGCAAPGWRVRAGAAKLAAACNLSALRFTMCWTHEVLYRASALIVGVVPWSLVWHWMHARGTELRTCHALASKDAKLPVLCVDAEAFIAWTVRALFTAGSSGKPAAHFVVSPC